jgi:Clostripain family
MSLFMAKFVSCCIPWRVCLYVLIVFLWLKHPFNISPFCFLLSLDNNLEVFLRKDIVELIRSPGIQDASLTTWIYLDQRKTVGLTGDDEGTEIIEELPLIHNLDGSEISGAKFEGSRYMTFDHGMSKMVVDTVLNGEQNSDDPQTIIDFMLHALPDCVAKGAEEYFMMFSSHGSGFGFGGDEGIPEVAVNAEEKRGNGRRKLEQMNQDIVNAIQQALDTVEGSPPRLNVIGFDACLMSSLDAVSWSRGVASYLPSSSSEYS